MCVSTPLREGDMKPPSPTRGGLLPFLGRRAGWGKVFSCHKSPWVCVGKDIAGISTFSHVKSILSTCQIHRIASQMWRTQRFVCFFLFKKEIVEWFCLFFHGRAVLIKFMYSLKVRKTCLNPECFGSCLPCVCHVIRLNITQRVTDRAKTTSLLVCQSVLIAICETDPPEFPSSLC